MRRFLVCIHDATPAYERETRVMIRDLAPFLGRRLSFGVTLLEDPALEESLRKRAALSFQCFQEIGRLLRDRINAHTNLQVKIEN